ncbi:CRISPR-associated helicase/endonuclease Cas3 [Sulfodiicoccus acidiphilus]|uniref:CRISPR-associated helicase/endonuclease Cas3 n=1 Tax=Sulfodiicoccus acidiphilus TaxID=1670455 RepID=A0A348B5A5_9CREN|nr:CRISPR-associated helicase Cas3' [Sulfodiicoccus acidiphilus]BBD73357.1 CRISPR-associated helicase/endonuclease Cas3 [Sulfodiicoccus acidiphilus]GGU00910.1 CRISPR-associated helicase/endonuclease Cas3 [Sulfodiicoccus acidiphilus]
MAYYSHPNKELRDHLREVGEGAKENVISAGRSDLADYAFLAGGLHDIGKYTRYFQEHLITGRKVDCSDHAFLSSLVALHESKRFGNPVLAALTAVSVYSHHGQLKGLDRYSEVLTTKEMESENSSSCLSKQYEDLLSRWTEIRREVEWISGDIPPLGSLLREASSLTRKARLENKGWKEYFDGLLIFSSLIDADKHSAAGVKESELPLPEPEVLKSHLLSLTSPNPKVGEMREQLRAWALRFTPSSAFVTLVAPTGSGKTLAGTLVALKGGKRRVVYSLPFISVIEQNADVLARVLGEDRVLKFHHLALRFKEDETQDTESRLMLAESWDSPLVITTFEALVSTFFTSRNVNLKRFHNLAGSFLILDEVQAFPLEYLWLIREALEEMTKHLNVNVLLMTATLPLKDEANHPVTFVPNRYRVEFRRFEDVETPEELANSLELERSGMVELNTIASAEATFKVLVERGERPSFLSTRIVPKERWRRIQKIKRALEEGERVSLVTTQMVEAGVDLDFRRGYRDLGPLDSVIQAAGRVNRNYGEQGVLTLTKIQRNNSNRTDFSLIYGTLSEEITLKVLKKWRTGFQEKDVPEVLEEYYSEVRRRYNDFRTKDAEKLRRPIQELRYDEVEMRLIRNEPKYPVYVTLDDEAEEVLSRLREVLKERGYERRAKLKALRGSAEQYVVRVWEEPSLTFDERLGWYVLEKEELDRFYDRDTGFRKMKEEGAVLW